MDEYIGNINTKDIVGADENGVSIAMTIGCATCQYETGLMIGLTADYHHMIVACRNCKQIVTVVDCGDQYVGITCHICGSNKSHHH